MFLPRRVLVRSAIVAFLGLLGFVILVSAISSPSPDLSPFPSRQEGSWPFSHIAPFRALAPFKALTSLRSCLSLPSLSGIYTRTYGYPEVVYVPDYTSGPHVTADSAILMESKTGTILYAKNEHVRRPQASTTKIMTAILALERGELDSIVTVSKRAAGVEGSSLWLR